jgi:hypothetical protein
MFQAHGRVSRATNTSHAKCLTYAIPTSLYRTSESPPFAARTHIKHRDGGVIMVGPPVQKRGLGVATR